MNKILIFAAVIVASVSAIAAQCAGVTKKGKQCKRQAAPGSAYCWQHGGSSVPAAPKGTSIKNLEAEDKPSAATSPIVSNSVKTNLLVKSFLGVSVGSNIKKITGVPIQGKSNAKLVTIRTFRRFSKATVLYLPDRGEIYGVTADCIFSDKTGKEDAFKEATSIRQAIELKCGIKFKTIAGGGYSSPVGGAIWTAPECSYEYFEPGRLDMRITCAPTKIENKGMKGPNVPTHLNAWKLSLSFTILNAKQTDLASFANGLELP